MVFMIFSKINNPHWIREKDSIVSLVSMLDESDIESAISLSKSFE